jgi:sterol desaturase/sphingolipid hydroxylase (fatty acid hydroxylase superfamily)
LLHRWRPFWLLHAVHHADPYVDVSTGLRHHPIEVAVQVVGKVGLYLALGIPLWIEAARTVMLNPMVLMQHANIRYPIGLERSMAWLFVTPGMHRVHHLPDPQHTNCNFGQVFTIWDRLFGTYRSIRIPTDAQFGLRNLAGDSWQTVRGMLLTPFLARRIDPL